MKAILGFCRFFLLLALILIPTLAMGAAKVAAKQEWWQILVAWLLEVVLLLGVPIVVVFVVALLKRYNINIEQAQVEKIAKAAADFAEQKAKKALKAGEKKTEGAKKMELALGFAKTMAEQYKLKEKVTGKMQELIEAQLGAKGEKKSEKKEPPTTTA